MDQGAAMRDALNTGWRSIVDTVFGLACFGGRSRIVDVVWFWIAMIVVQLIATPLIASLAWDTKWWAGAIVRVLVAVPMFALFWRRLQDQGIPGWWALIALPLLPASLYQSYRATFAVVNPHWLVEPSPVGPMVPWLMGVALVMLVLLLRPGQRGENRYGPDPREATDQASNARVAASTSS